MKEKVNRLVDYLKIYTNDTIIISDGAGWVIDNVSYNMSQSLCKKGIRSAVVSNIAIKNLTFLKGKTLYFVDRWSYLVKDSTEIFKKLSKNNRIIVMWWHSGAASNNAQLLSSLDTLKDLLPYVSIVHVSCHQEQKILIEEGALKEKVKVIPEGIEDFFKTLSEQERQAKRKLLKIPLDSFCIGFFQKDGIGWGEGNEPKLEKGPDVFIEVIKKVFEKNKNIFVVLTGPSRGYVKNKLKSLGIPFIHKYLSDYKDIIDYYSVLDLYLITSRTEGGPKSVLEAFACGVPVVSTKVGMCLDVISDGDNGFLCDIEDVDSLCNKVNTLIADRELRVQIVESALKKAKEYRWGNVINGIINNCFELQEKRQVKEYV